jgi:hypothetical protein
VLYIEGPVGLLIQYQADNWAHIWTHTYMGTYLGTYGTVLYEYISNERMNRKEVETMLLYSLHGIARPPLQYIDTTHTCTVDGWHVPTTSVTLERRSADLSLASASHSKALLPIRDSPPSVIPCVRCVQCPQHGAFGPCRGRLTPGPGNPTHPSQSHYPLLRT